jgi:hypothetical protein
MHRPPFLFLSVAANAVGSAAAQEDLKYPEGYATSEGRPERGFREWSQAVADKNFHSALTATLIGFFLIICGLVHEYGQTVPTPEPDRNTGPKKKVSFVRKAD